MARRVPRNKFLREFDLANIMVAETNAARVNQQISAMGVHPINGFHHELAKLPNGGYLALADSERILFNIQGAGNVDVIGDTILVLDQNMQVTWAWDAFNYLDTSPGWLAWARHAAIPPGLPARLFT